MKKHNNFMNYEAPSRQQQSGAQQQKGMERMRSFTNANITNEFEQDKPEVAAKIQTPRGGFQQEYANQFSMFGPQYQQQQQQQQQDYSRQQQYYMPSASKQQAYQFQAQEDDGYSGPRLSNSSSRAKLRESNAGLNDSRVSLQNDQDFNEILGLNRQHQSIAQQQAQHVAPKVQDYKTKFAKFTREYQKAPHSSEQQKILDTLFAGFNEIDESCKRLNEDVGYYNQIEDPHPKSNTNAIFLIGKTEAGKSTIANMLAGKRLFAEAYNMSIRIKVPDESPIKVGHGFVSCTKVPMVLKDNAGNIIIDCPGAEDTNAEQEILNSIYIEHITSKFNKMGLILIISHHDFDTRAKPLINTLKYITKVMPDIKNLKDSICLLVNKLDSRFNITSVVQALQELSKQEQSQDPKLQELFKIFLSQSNNITYFNAPNKDNGELDPSSLGSNHVRGAIAKIKTNIADKFKLALSSDAESKLKEIIKNTEQVLHKHLVDLGNIIMNANIVLRGSPDETINIIHLWDIMNERFTRFDNDRMKSVNIINKISSLLRLSNDDKLCVNIAIHLKLITFLVDRYKSIIGSFDNKKVWQELGDILSSKICDMLKDSSTKCYQMLENEINNLMKSISNFQLPKSIDHIKAYLDSMNSLGGNLRNLNIENICNDLEQLGKNGSKSRGDSIISYSMKPFKSNFDGKNVSFSETYQKYIGKDSNKMICDNVSKKLPEFNKQFQGIIDSINLRDVKVTGSDIVTMIYIITEYIPKMSDANKSLEQKAIGLYSVANAMRDGQTVKFNLDNVSKVEMLEEVKKTFLELSGINENAYNKIIEGGHILHKPSKVIFHKAGKYKDFLKDISLKIGNMYKESGNLLKAAEHYKLCGNYNAVQECYDTLLQRTSKSTAEYYKILMLKANFEISEQRFDNASKIYSYIKSDLKNQHNSAYNKVLSDVYTKIGICILQHDTKSHSLKKKFNSKITKALSFDHDNQEAQMLKQNICGGDHSDIFKLYEV